MRFFLRICDLLGVVTIGYVVVSFGISIFVSPSACVRYIVTVKNTTQHGYGGRLNLADRLVWTGPIKPGESRQIYLHDGDEGDFLFEAKPDDGRAPLSLESRGAQWKKADETKYREFVIAADGGQLVEMSSAQLKAASMENLIPQVNPYHCKNYDFWRSIFQ